MAEYKQYNITTGAAFGIAFLLGMFVGVNHGIMNGIFTILILSGAYLSLSLYLRDREDNTGGPSELGAAVVGGFLLAGIGVCGLVYNFTESVVITVVCLIAVMLLSSAILFSRYRKYL